MDSLDQLRVVNGFLDCPAATEIMAQLHKMQPLLLEDVPAAGLRRDKTFTTAIHCVHLAFASAAVHPRREGCDEEKGKSFKPLGPAL